MGNKRLGFWTAGVVSLEGVAFLSNSSNNSSFLSNKQLGFSAAGVACWLEGVAFLSNSSL